MSSNPIVQKYHIQKSLTAIDVSGALSIVGDVDVATDKFTVAAATGDTAVAGDFAIATNKLTVAAATGNTAIAGTLGVTGATAITGNLAVNTDKFTVAAASGNTLVAGTLAVTGNSTLTGTATITGGIVLGMPVRLPNIPIGSVAYASLGTSTTPTAGTIYYAEIQIPARMVCAGAAVLNGGTAATDTVILGLYSSAGALLASSALAGTTASGANAFQAIAFTAPYTATGGRYYLAYQASGTTTRFRSIAVSTFLNSTGSQAGSAGTMATIASPAITTTADVGPIGYVYSAA